jgi:holliday junction DNA helicase RuvB
MGYCDWETFEEELRAEQNQASGANATSSRRPQRLSEIIGQNEIRNSLTSRILTAKKLSAPLGHMGFFGVAGVGKTTTAKAVAEEMGSKFHYYFGDQLQTRGEILGMIANVFSGDIVFVDEIHLMGKTAQQVLYPILEDFSYTSSEGQVVSVPRFTLIGATTDSGDLLSPLRGRLKYHDYFMQYTVEELTTIVMHAGYRTYGLDLNKRVAKLVASLSMRVARNAVNLLDLLVDHAHAQVRGELYGDLINEEMLLTALKNNRVDPIVGLDCVSRKYLHALAAYNRPVGIGSLATMIREKATNLENIVEPALFNEAEIENSFGRFRGPMVLLTPRGRSITEVGRAYLDRCRELQAEDWFSGEAI